MPKKSGKSRLSNTEKELFGILKNVLGMAIRYANGKKSPASEIRKAMFRVWTLNPKFKLKKDDTIFREQEFFRSQNSATFLSSDPAIWLTDLF